MANRVVLDAMIRRADFAQQAEASAFELADKLRLADLQDDNPIARLLRKPDFQRETNHWSPAQVASLVKSFATGELIPALILWKSESFIFVIDGAHRLSALKAWMENDYGDKGRSLSFFDSNIQKDQMKKAHDTRVLVEREVGRYSDFLSMNDEARASDPEGAKIHSTIFSRALAVQWIQGSREVAESSFFKINSQGTPLDPVEELLLRYRKRSYAIASRAVVRSGSGHKYWSDFDSETQRTIENFAGQANTMLFQPDVMEPIKTLDLPLGGTASPVDALKILIDLLSIIDGSTDSEKKIKALDDDPRGTETIGVLKNLISVASRLTGNSPGSLGLHPAVYFYTERGKHSRFLFLGVFRLFASVVKNNDGDFFKKFSAARERLEKILLDRKSLINQGLANVNSRQRIDRVSELIKGLVKALSEEKPTDDVMILKLLGLEGAAGNLQIIDAPQGFSDDVKSAIFLRGAVTAALRCPICGGLVEPVKSATFDHVQRVREGGLGTATNGQLVHPYCNSAVKN